MQSLQSQPTAPSMLASIAVECRAARIEATSIEEPWRRSHAPVSGKLLPIVSTAIASGRPVSNERHVQTICKQDWISRVCVVATQRNATQVAQPRPCMRSNPTHADTDTRAPAAYAHTKRTCI